MSQSPVLLEGATVLTLNPRADVHRAGRVYVKEGCIAGVGTTVDVDDTPDKLGLYGCIVLPGLIQAHVHLGQTFFRGLAERRTLLAWLGERIWPLEAAHDDESAYWCTLLGAAECLLGGTTTVQEIGLGPGSRGLLEALVESGLRAQAGMCLMDEGEGLPEGLRQDTDRALAQTVTLGEEFQGAGDGRISYSLNPRFILTGSDALWRGLRELSHEHAWPVHTHALEQAEETAAVRALKQGRDEVEYFDAEGLLDTDLRIAHGVCMTDDHMQTVRGSRFSVAHCPSANLKLGSGIANILRMRSNGIPVGVGADGAACNNDLDCLLEVRLAALLQQVEHGPAALTGVDALRLATSEGARALGLEEEIGSLEVGKRADLVVLEVDGPSWAADERVDPHDLVVYGAGRAAVRDVMIDGRWVVRDRRLIGLDLPHILRRVASTRSDLLDRSGLSI